MTALWASVDDIVPPPGLSDDDVLEALEIASTTLWNLTGRLYSPEQRVVEGYDTQHVLNRRSEVYPLYSDGAVYNITGCESCVCTNCGVTHRTRLRGYPVKGVHAVWIDDVLLNPADVVILDNAVLGLFTTRACCARCIVVDYTYGTGIPPGGRRAAIKMANEFLSSWAGQDCALPERVTSVSRQGLSWGLLDPQDFLESGRTGLYEVDLLLRTLNPAKALRRPRVFSPDLPRVERRSYPEAPRYVDLTTGTHVVTPGLPAYWYSKDHDLISALADYETLTTQVYVPLADTGAWSTPPFSLDFFTAETSDPFELSGKWHTYGEGSPWALIHVTGEETAQMQGWSIYVITSDDGSFTKTGWVQVL